MQPYTYIELHKEIKELMMLTYIGITALIIGFGWILTTIRENEIRRDPEEYRNFLGRYRNR